VVLALEVAVACASGAAVLALAVLTSLRIRYPFALEWMEGAVLDHIRMTAAGRELYREPSLEFTPFIYPPLYYYVCALLSKAVGLGFFLPRLVSTVSIACVLLWLWRWVRDETGDSLAAIASTGLFAATYPVTGYWFDLARVDSLGLGWMVGAYALGRRGQGVWRFAAMGALMGLAVLTKQSLAPVALPGLVFAFARGRWCGAGACGALALVAGGALWRMQAVTGGWFGYYVLGLPAQHDVAWDALGAAMAATLWAPFGCVLLWAALALASPAIGSKGRDRWLLHAGLVLCSVVASIVSVVHRDGFVNVMIPAYFFLALVAGHGIAWARRRDASGAPVLGARYRAFAAATLLLNLGLLGREYRACVPTREDVRAGSAMLARLRAVQGKVLMPGDGYYLAMAGHPEMGAHAMAIADVFKGRDEALKARLRQSIALAIRARSFSAIVTSEGTELMPPEVTWEIGQAYVPWAPVFGPGQEERCWPQSGFRTRPQRLWVPK
jgi:hypothetical protein